MVNDAPFRKVAAKGESWFVRSDPETGVAVIEGETGVIVVPLFPVHPAKTTPAMMSKRNNPVLKSCVMHAHKEMDPLNFGVPFRF
jgi:hypothetical protein